MKSTRNTLILTLLFSALITLTFLYSAAKADPNTTLLPIGASYQQDTLSYFAEQAIARNTDSIVEIRVLPITYATNPINISPAERADNLAQAQVRASEIETACDLIVTPPTMCNSQVTDIQVRNDAQNPTLANQINTTTDGVFILGGDQTIAMEVTANTLLEDVLETHYLAGLPIGGTSAGAAVQSRYMIGGYVGNNSAWDALKLGAVDLWYGDLSTTHRGLRFVFEGGVIEQHVLERGRIARLLQAAEQLPANHIGIGVDWGTGALIQNETLILESNGAYAVVVVDQETYDSAANAVYVGPDNILSIRNVGFHVIPPGALGYDITNRQPLVNGVPQPAPAPGVRDFGITLPSAGAGALFIAGDLATDPFGPVVQDFATLAQTSGLPTVVFSVGYQNNNAAINAANTWASSMTQSGVSNVQTAPLTTNADLNAIATQLASAGAIFTIGGSQSILVDQISILQGAGIDQVLLQRWQTGGHLLFDNAAAAAVGSWMSDAPTPSDVEIEASDSFINGHVPTAPGLGLVPGAVFEPRFLYDYLYGRLVGLAHAHPETVGLGIERNTAVKITPQEIRIIGKMAVMTIDPRHATFQGLGSNNMYAAAWLLLDTFPTGELIPAGAVSPTATPSPTATGPTPTPTLTSTPTTGPTATSTPTPRGGATHTPSPTSPGSSTLTPSPTATPRPGRDTPTVTPTPIAQTPTPTPGSGSTMHIGDLDGSSISGNPGRWDATVVITVHDSAHNPLAGATITGLWSNGGSGSCVTDASGQCSVSKVGIRNSALSITYTVSNVSHSSLNYQPSDNHDPDGDSSGTVIVINKP